MDWELQLTMLYEYVDHHYHKELWVYCQRMSNNSQPKFSDVEVLTTYLFGRIKKRREIIDIYEYIRDHLLEWFPQLPHYKNYVRRLNYLCNVFSGLLEKIILDFPNTDVLHTMKLIDSMPIILANSKRSQTAKVAREFANKGYCASKGIYYYGIKLHILAIKRLNALPLPDYIGITPARDHDLKALEIILPQLSDSELFADKAYINELLKNIAEQEQNFQIHTPVKKKKRQERELDYFEKLLSTAVSRVRQPIESLFNWIEQKTGIQTASKVRSYNGLITHVFGSLAAAMFILAFNL